jgi:N-acetylglucosamine malate deacetylase 2
MTLIRQPVFSRYIIIFYPSIFINMKRTIRILLIIVAIILLAATAHLLYLRSLAPKETYPDDTWLATASNKTALIIVAHDDDMIGSSGTIALLCRNGWQVREMCFYQQGGLYAEKDSLKNPVRKKDLQTAATIQGIKEVSAIDFNFRYDMHTKQAYMPAPYDSFGTMFMIDSLSGYVAAYIEQYKPSVIFTLDDIMGGYGNPDHVLISRIVLDYCQAHKTDKGFSVQKIYQPVFPKDLAEKVLNPLPVYQQAKQVYGVQGMPAPDVQIDVSSYGRLKKQAMKAYSTEQNSIRKIWPYYNWYPSWIYFRIFNRDFFRVITL